MRIFLPLTALLLTTGASAEPPRQIQAPGQPPSVAACRDRVLEVRRELGKPALERNAAPQDPLLIAAVDRRIGGCSMMVMRNDTSDVRSLPAPGEHRMMPSR